MANNAARRTGIIFALIGIGFAGLIGADVVATWLPGRPGDANAVWPFALSIIGTLAFIAAGIMAFRLLRQGSSS